LFFEFFNEFLALLFVEAIDIDFLVLFLGNCLSYGD